MAWSRKSKIDQRDFILAARCLGAASPRGNPTIRGLAAVVGLSQPAVLRRMRVAGIETNRLGCRRPASRVKLAKYFYTSTQARRLRSDISLDDLGGRALEVLRTMRVFEACGVGGCGAGRGAVSAAVWSDQAAHPSDHDRAQFLGRDAGPGDQGRVDVILAEAVEDLARALGLWLDGHDTSRPDNRRWTLYANETCEFLLKSWEGTSMNLLDEEWTLTPSEAMLWLRCALLGPTRERCPDCAWSIARDEDGFTRARVGHGYAVCKTPSGAGAPGTDFAADHEGVELRLVPCPTCSGPAVECPGCRSESGQMNHDAAGGWDTCDDTGTVSGEPTGWVTHEHGWADRFLRAKPQECKACLGRVTVGHEDESHEPVMCGACEDGDPEAREISVKADELAERGQPGCSTCEGSQLEKAGTVLGFLATGTLDAWKRSNPESEGWSVWSQPERGVMIGGDGVRIVCRRPCPSCASARRLGLWLALWLAGKQCGACDGLGADIGEHGNPHEQGDCEPCHGSGLELGHHTDAMAEAARALAVDLDRAELK